MLFNFWQLSSVCQGGGSPSLEHTVSNNQFNTCCFIASPGQDHSQRQHCVISISSFTSHSPAQSTSTTIPHTYLQQSRHAVEVITTISSAYSLKMLTTTCSLVMVLCSLVTSVAAKHCATFTIPVHVRARNGDFRIPIPHSNLDVTQFALDLTSTSNNFTNSSLVGYATVKGEAFISARFCTPESMPKQPVVQLLTHGIGFDKT